MAASQGLRISISCLSVQTDMPTRNRQLGEERRHPDAMRSLNGTSWKSGHGVRLGFAGQIMGPGDLLVLSRISYVS